VCECSENEIHGVIDLIQTAERIQCIRDLTYCPAIINSHLSSGLTNTQFANQRFRSLESCPSLSTHVRLSALGSNKTVTFLPIG